MIRRDYTPLGQPDQWMLFPQIHHAVLAALLADHWHSPNFAPLEPPGELLAAIGGHDNGWRTWDESPQLDPTLGRPLAFNEMPTAESLAIWTRSIEAGLEMSPLVAYAIAGHFTKLLEQFDSWRKTESTRHLGEQFLAEKARLMSDWLWAWETQDPSHNTPAIADRAVEFVRMFDALSLWLMCAERTEASTFATPDGPALTITPITPYDLTVEPWPFDGPLFELSATGRLIPQRRYNSTAELLAVPPVEATLQWTLKPI